MLTAFTSYLIKRYIVVFLGVLLTAIAETLRPKRAKAQILLIFGMIVSGSGGIYAAIESEKFERDIQGNILGGDSFCYVQPYFDPQGNLYFGLIHEGKYPLYDVNIVINDHSRRGELIEALGIHGRKFTNDEWNAFIKSQDLIGTFLDIDTKSMIFKYVWPSLTPRALILPLLKVDLPKNRNEQRYLIKIYARNGTITQPIRFLKVNGSWESSTRIQRYDDIHTKVIELKKKLHPAVSLEETYAGE